MANKQKDLLPVNLQGDKNIEGLCAAIDAAFGIEGELGKFFVYDPANVPAAALPFLAWQFHVEGWELADTEEKQRNLVKTAIELHLYKGTPYAIEKVLSSLNLNGIIEEWMEYGGDPYYFRIIIELAGAGITEEVQEKLERLVNDYKNLRSWLELITLRAILQGNVPVYAIAAYSGEYGTIYPAIAATILRDMGLEIPVGGFYGDDDLALDIAVQGYV